MLSINDIVTKTGLFQAAEGIYSGSSAGIDRMSTKQFLELLEDTFLGSDLIEAIRAGTYKPMAMETRLIPKPDGTHRKIFIPTVTDRAIQKMIVTGLTPITESRFVEESYGFRPGRNTYQAVKRASELTKAGNRACLLIDLRNFFGNIDRERLNKLIRDYGISPEVRKLVNQFMTMKAVDKYQVSKVSGIPAGIPIAPLLANVYLHPLDKFLERNGTPFVRYADDISLFFRSTSEAESFLEKFTGICGQDFKVVINQSKTITVTAGSRSILGFLVDDCGGISFSAKAIGNLREKLSDLADAQLSLKEIAVRAKSIVYGLLAYYRHIDDFESLKAAIDGLLHEFRYVLKSRFSAFESALWAEVPPSRIDEISEAATEGLWRLFPAVTFTSG